MTKSKQDPLKFFYVQINTKEEAEKLLLILSFCKIDVSSLMMHIHPLPYYFYRFQTSLSRYTGAESSLEETQLVKKPIEFFYTL